MHIAILHGAVPLRKLSNDSAEANSKNEKQIHLLVVMPLLLVAMVPNSFLPL